jgi:hypothetical protein
VRHRDSPRSRPTASATRTRCKTTSLAWAHGGHRNGLLIRWRCARRRASCGRRTLSLRTSPSRARHSELGGRARPYCHLWGDTLSGSTGPPSLFGSLPRAARIVPGLRPRAIGLRGHLGYSGSDAARPADYARGAPRPRPSCTVTGRTRNLVLPPSERCAETLSG